MKGREPFTKEQIQAILNQFTGIHKVRNQTLLILGCYTGFRISEMLSLRIKDIYRGGQILNYAYIRKQNVKKQTEGKAIPLNNTAKIALTRLINDLDDWGIKEPGAPLFLNKNSYKRPHNKVDDKPKINASGRKKLMDKINELSNTKTQQRKDVEGSSVPLNEYVRKQLMRCITDMHRQGLRDEETPIFKSTKGDFKAISREQAWRILKRACNDCGIFGETGTHSMRKTFAAEVDKKFGGDKFKTQKAMRHQKIESTLNYLMFNETEINNAVLSVDYELNLD